MPSLRNDRDNAPPPPTYWRRCCRWIRGWPGASRGPRRLDEVQPGERQRCRQAVYPVEDTAVPWEQLAAILGAGLALDPRLEQVADDAECGQHAREQQHGQMIVAARGWLQDQACRQRIAEHGDVSAHDAFPGLARADLRRELVASETMAREIR